MTRAILLALVLAFTGCKKDRDAPAPPRSPTPTPTPAPTAKPAAAAAPSDYIELDPRRPIGPPMAEHAKAALAAGKKPYAYLHASWCEPCNAIAATRTTDPQMIDAFKGTVLIALDIDHVPPQQLIDQSLPFSVIPVFYRLDASGVPDGESIDGGAWGDNIPANMAPPLKSFFAR